MLLELVSFSLIIVHNNYQRTVFLEYSTSFFGYLSSTVTQVRDYFHLEGDNEKLIEENNRLRNQIEALKLFREQEESDTLWKSFFSREVNYVYKTAKMIHFGFNKTKNYITVNKGEEEGIEPEMAVCSEDGVVGVVEKVSRHYARVLPLINTNLRISAKIRKNGYYGSLQWDGNDYRYSYLNDIPFHVSAEIGDTIVTSGFSSIFPEGVTIGFIESVNKQTANFLSIKVKLATDFKRISDVYLIANTKKQEQRQLEENHDD